MLIRNFYLTFKVRAVLIRNFYLTFRDIVTRFATFVHYPNSIARTLCNVYVCIAWFREYKLNTLKCKAIPNGARIYGINDLPTFVKLCQYEGNSTVCSRTKLAIKGMFRFAVYRSLYLFLAYLYPRIHESAVFFASRKKNDVLCHV